MSTSKISLHLAATFAIVLGAILVADWASGGAERTLGTREAAAIYGGDVVMDRDCLDVAACSAADPCNLSFDCDITEETVPTDEGDGQDCSLPQVGTDCDDGGGNVDCAYIYQCEIKMGMCMPKTSYSRAVRAPQTCDAGPRMDDE